MFPNFIYRSGIYRERRKGWAATIFLQEPVASEQKGFQGRSSIKAMRSPDKDKTLARNGIVTLVVLEKTKINHQADQ
jgi:hypothetical protein